MKPCTPAIFTAAIFTALLVLDLIAKNYKDVGFHVAGGIFCVIGLYTACELGGEMMAWVLLAIPFFFLVIGLGMIWADAQKDAPSVVPAEPVDDCPCYSCGRCPCRCRRECPPSTSVTPPRPQAPLPPPFGCPRKA